VDPTERIELSEAINHEWFSCISNQAKTKSSASSVSDTNDSLKLNSRKLEDARSCTAQNFQVSRKERKISTSLPKEKNKGNPKEKGKETEKEVERNMEK
jgi:serine/threonine protein kinase